MKPKSMIAAAVFAGALAFTETAEAQSFIYCSEGSPEGFNPSLYTSTTTFDVTRQIYEQLVEVDPETLTIEPALAESWEISDDGRSYTFHLRQGVPFQSNGHFQPSRPFNADDVVFSFQRQLDPENPYNKVSGGQYTVFYAMGLPDLIAGIEKLDAHRLRFHLKRPDASFLAALSMDFAAIFSAEYADQMLQAGTPEKVDQDPIGSGPFALVAYQRDTAVRFRAFEEYRRGRAQIANLIFDITVDPSVRYLKLRAGECHLIAYPNPAQLDEMKGNPHIVLKSWDGFNISYLAFNTEKTPYEDPRVRRALTHAIDKGAIVQVIFAGTAIAATSPLPPLSWAYDGALDRDAYDPEKARALLAEAGYAGGFDTDLWAMPVQRPYNPNARRMAELIQADWARVGVRAKIVSFEWAEYLRRSKLGEHQTLLLGWGGQNGDPDDFLSPLLSCNAKLVSGLNRARWCDEAFDGYLDKARVITDIPLRKALYVAAQKIFQEEAPWVAIAHAQVVEAIRKEVLNTQSSPFGRRIFYPVSLAEGGE